MHQYCFIVVDSVWGEEQEDTAARLRGTLLQDMHQSSEPARRLDALQTVGGAAACLWVVCVILIML